VAIDPAVSTHEHSCEVGLVGGGADASAAYVTHDKSGVMGAGVGGWPTVAWDLADALQDLYPAADFAFVIEINKGGNLGPEALRQEERRRRMARGESGISTAAIHEVKAVKSKTQRAQAPARAAFGNQVFWERLPVVEGQLRELTDGGTKSDRADAAVHLVNDLVGDPKPDAAGCPLCGGAAQCQQCHAVPCRCVPVGTMLPAQYPQAPPPPPQPPVTSYVGQAPGSFFSRLRDRPL
jgi:phage terminase large subunit-like protein